MKKHLFSIMAIFITLFYAGYTSTAIKSLIKLKLQEKFQSGTKSNAKSINLIPDTKINTDRLITVSLVESG